jgi:hypothetical protein
MGDTGHMPAEDPRLMSSELDAIQMRLRALRDRLEAFEPWDHKASAARLHAANLEAEHSDGPRA